MTTREWSLLEVDIAVNSWSPDATDAIRWFWANGHVFERHGEFIRHATRWCARPELRAVVSSLRQAPPMIDERGRYPGLMEWLALNDALGDRAATLEWFDQRVAQGQRPPELSRLRRALFDAGRLGDFVGFCEPLEGVENWLAPREDRPDDPRYLLEVAAEVVLWREVARLRRPDQLTAIDQRISASDLAVQVASLAGRPLAEVFELAV